MQSETLIHWLRYHIPAASLRGQAEAWARSKAGERRLASKGGASRGPYPAGKVDFLAPTRYRIAALRQGRTAGPKGSCGSAQVPIV